jgi:hypothetical protein
MSVFMQHATTAHARIAATGEPDAPQQSRAGVTPTSSDSRRDLRVDFFRGLALWMILWGHCLHVTGDAHVALRITGYYWLFSDALEIFIFLSGYAFGIAYGRTYERSGLLICQVKAVNRCWQLYAANAICLVFVLAIVGGFGARNSIAYAHVAPLLDDPGRRLPQFLAMTCLPWLFQILPLYIVMLLPMPLMLAVARRSRVLALAISASIYLAAQLLPWLNYPSYEHAGATWFFNPFAWQFLFVLGLILAKHFHEGRAPLPRATWMVVLALLVTLSPVFWRVATFMAVRDIAGLGRFVEVLKTVTFPYVQGKGTLGPLRLVHFLAMVYLVAALLPHTLALWRHALARPLIQCGQASLEIYCLGVVLTYAVGVILLPGRTDVATHALLNVAAIVLSVAFAYLLKYRRETVK